MAEVYHINTSNAALSEGRAPAVCVELVG